MQRGIITLNDEKRYTTSYTISKEKLDSAVKAATKKLESKLNAYAEQFVGTYSKNYVYPLGENKTWVSGMHTGTILLAYELTGDEKFLECAKRNIPFYKKRLEEKTTMYSHDVGFVFSPSCVALYKLTGDEVAREIALAAAHHLYDASFSKKRRIYYPFGK